MAILVFLVCFLACAVGGICGIGGGVIIKPVLDAFHIMSVSSISVLSGLTVFSMAVVSVIRQRKSCLLDIQIGTSLAVGAAVGGYVGKELFNAIKYIAGQDAVVGMIQALLLACITLLTLLYSVYLRQRIPSFHIEGKAPCLLLGNVMGVTSSFLGIGGGPINLAILYFAFSMDTKKAAATSLYIIMFSQGASVLTDCLQGTLPDLSWTHLVLMMTAGIMGGLIGSRINKKLSAAVTDKLFAGLQTVIILICIYNACRFAHVAENMAMRYNITV